MKKYKDNPDSEFFYYTFFAKWLKRSFGNIGTDHRIRFCAKDHPHEFDIVGGYKHERVEKYTLFCIEVKMNDVNKVISQAVIRSLWFDYRYIAMPFGRTKGNTAYIIYNYGKNFEVFNEFGIGVLFYDVVTKSVIDVHNAVQHKKHPPDKNYKQRIINKLWDKEIQPEPIVVGPKITDFIPELNKRRR